MPGVIAQGMCGIGGILRTDGQPIPEEWLDLIDTRIAWRGPDGHGRFRDRVEIADENTPGGKRIVEVAFVHRRLSIIDHEGGHQPMVSDRGRNEKEGLVAVVFNGCIYNHRELRKELEGKGHAFITDHSDTEVLIHGWREWGEKLIHHLEGMYAFAVWDRASRLLFLARDPFGEKPLHIRETETVAADNISLVTPVIAFASTSSPLSELPHAGEVCGDWCRFDWLIPYLFLGRGWGYMPGPNSIDITGIGPGSGQVIKAHPAQPAYEVVNVDLTCDGFVYSDIEQSLRTAVGKMLDADVPLGCFLSGGIDSSLITSLAREFRPDIMTFSVRMPDPRYDESSHARSVAQHLNVNHQLLDVNPRAAADLVHLITLLGEPFGDSSILPTYWVSKAAREHIKVALSGDGGDELFFGYDRYCAAPFLERHWCWLKHLPASGLYRFHPKSRLHRLARLADMARDYQAVGVVAMEQVFTRRQIAELQPDFIDEDWKCSMDDHSKDSGYGWFGRRHNHTGLSDLREFDLHNYLPHDLLRKVDTASMACGLEVRCPFLDRDLARAALSMPIEQLMPCGQRKGLLRQIARKYLPKEIVDRPKMGFAIPIGEWFRNDELPHKGSGMKTLLLDHLNSAEPFGPIQLNRKAVQRFIDEHMSCKRDHGQKLFTLLTLSIWARGLGTKSAHT